MYYNRNLISTSEQAVTRTDASGIFDLQTQAVSQNEKDWPGSETASIIYDITIGTDNLTIEIPSTGTVNYTIDWGDGTVVTSTSNLPSHTYSSTGSYKVKIFSTDVYRPYVNNNATLREVLRSVEITEKANLGTSLREAFYRCSKMNTFKCAFSATSSVTVFQAMLNGCTVLSQIDLFDTSSGTNLSGLFFGNRTGFFPVLNFSSATSISGMYRDTSNVATLPTVNTSNVEEFVATWRSCHITTFPSFYDFSSATDFSEAWGGSRIYNFPANMFHDPATGNAKTGTLATNAFHNAFSGCRLTADAIKNILMSLDANGQNANGVGISLHIGGGQNAAHSSWHQDAKDALTSLQNKNWTVTYNS